MRAALLPSAALRWTRFRSMATNANSAATKKPVTKMSSRTAMRPSAVVMCAGYCPVNPAQVLLAALAMALGARIQGTVGLTASGLELARTRHMLIGAGIVSGYMATITAIGGPPVALLYHRDNAAAAVTVVVRELL
jgi:hypothetical protein